MTSHPMTLAQLRAFQAAARCGSFTAAAAELRLTQASVSELVRRLEEEYGLVLFSRGSRRLSLTGAGELLKPIADGAIAAFDHADQALRAFGGLTGGVATFGVMRNAEYYLLSDLAQTFHERFPEVQIRLIGQNSVDVAAAVASGELEAGIVVLPVGVTGLDVRPLLRDEVVMVTREPERWGSAVRGEDLAAAPLILYDAHYGWDEPTRRQVMQRAQSAGVTLKPIIETEHVSSALRLVERGMGDTFVSRAVTKGPDFPPGLHLIPFEEPVFDTIASITRDAGILSPASRQLLQLAEEMLLAGSS
ncbi:LysR family transcriptional regulator [Streptomyces sp. Pv4-95]|uniref:LysR family transcriptional regulator n=1 Tax=Streptomyces sp. Pv4-95 TaxID=3049543 RepID=UPI0038915BAA